MGTLRTISVGLIVIGLSGAALLHMQSRRSALPTASRAAVSQSSSRSHVRTRAGGAPGAGELADREAAEFFAAIASAATPRRSTAASTAALRPMAGDEDVDLTDPELRVPLARFALASVGVDDVAEALWLDAINDPTIDAEARKDLIEDLNEDGFADPKHPEKGDLALIEARLSLIDRLAPQAMDETNAAAFAEARKDLGAMRETLLHGLAIPGPEGAGGAASGVPGVAPEPVH